MRDVSIVLLLCLQLHFSHFNMKGKQWDLQEKVLHLCVFVKNASKSYSVWKIAFDFSGAFRSIYVCLKQAHDSKVKFLILCSWLTFLSPSSAQTLKKKKKTSFCSLRFHKGTAKILDLSVRNLIKHTLKSSYPHNA